MAAFISVREIKKTPCDAEGIFALAATREGRLSRVLALYIVAGLFFMLLPGTFLGVWNLFAISSHKSVATVSPAWIQAHGHAQIFGWIGSFILGIGYYSIPKILRLRPFALWAPRTSFALWVSGVSLRWVTGVYAWHWRTLLPLSAAFEIAAFLIFFRAVSGHRSESGQGSSKVEPWVLVVIAGSIGWLSSLIVNLLSAAFLGWRGSSPTLPHRFDERFLVLETWGFLVPFIWGFSAKWLPIFLGLRPLRNRALLCAVALNSAGVIAALCGLIFTAAVVLLAGLASAIYALRLFESAERAAKTMGVHPSFPIFIRLAYVWALISATLAIWAALVPRATGIWGASRHALTVGFVAIMVFSVGQRVLPAFCGMKLLFSTRLMFASLALLSIGCLLRVSSEVLAYQGFVHSAWAWLPVSAVAEMAAVTLFAVNLVLTIIRKKESNATLSANAA